METFEGKAAEIHFVILAATHLRVPVTMKQTEQISQSPTIIKVKITPRIMYTTAAIGLTGIKICLAKFAL